MPETKLTPAQDPGVDAAEPGAGTSEFRITNTMLICGTVVTVALIGLLAFSHPTAEQVIGLVTSLLGVGSIGAWLANRLMTLRTTRKNVVTQTAGQVQIARAQASAPAAGPTIQQADTVQIQQPQPGPVPQ